jgi:NADPH:quinone reductase
LPLAAGAARAYGRQACTRPPAHVGPAGNLCYEAVEDPRPGPGHVRVAVAVAGVHLMDTRIRAGERLAPYPLPELPAIPGREVAGVVDAIGPDVDESWLGRRVVGHLGAASGGDAEPSVCAEPSLHELPDGLAEDAAVAMVGTGRTTMAILEAAQLGPDDVASQRRRAASARCSSRRRAWPARGRRLAGGTHKVSRVQALGASVAVDYTRPEWPREVRDALDSREPTVALDGVAGDAGRAALELLAPGGRLILFGMASRRARAAVGRRPFRPRPDRLGGDRRARAAAPRRHARAGGRGACRGGGRATGASGRLAVPAVRGGGGARGDRGPGDGRQDRARALTGYVSRRRRSSPRSVPSGPPVMSTRPGNHQPHMPRIAPVPVRYRR